MGVVTMVACLPLAATGPAPSRGESAEYVQIPSRMAGHHRYWPGSGSPGAGRPGRQPAPGQIPEPATARPGFWPRAARRAASGARRFWSPPPSGAAAGPTVGWQEMRNT